MREAYKRCVHCQDVYLCLLSGGPSGYNTDHKDSSYCPDCLEAVNQALSRVPKKFEHDWVPTQVVTLAELLGWEQEAETERQVRGGFSVRRVMMGLINIETGQSQRTGYVQGRGEFAGRTFSYAFWPDREDEAEIKEEVERDLLTGVTRPWRNYG